MKQKMFYLVLLIIVMHLPAASKECAKLVHCAVTESSVVKAPEKVSGDIKENAAAELSEEAALPASPFTRIMLNL